MSLGSEKCRVISLANTWWSILSKKPLISPSSNHGTPVHLLISERAEWQPLEGRNPCEFVSNFWSNTSSMTIFRACWIILSRGEEIPSGLFFPLGLGMSTLRAGRNLYDSPIREFDASSNHWNGIPSNVSLSDPRTILPGLDLIVL